MSKAKFETCRHVEQVGDRVVFVKESCPNAKAAKGKRFIVRNTCKKCSSYEKAPTPNW